MVFTPTAARQGWLPPQLTERSVGWIVGLYEGEGSCSTDPRGVVRIQLSSTDLWTVERLRDLVGSGNVKTYKRKSGHKDIHRWRLNGVIAMKFALWIVGDLSPRRQVQVIESLERCNHLKAKR